MLTGTLLIVVVIAALLWIVIACSILKWHPFPVLLFTAIALGLLAGLPVAGIMKTIGDGAGSVFAGIGLIIALGTILGMILEKSGAALTLAESMLKRTGKKRLLPAMGFLGALVGIPVFCDSGFVILANLGRSLSRKSGIATGAISVALASGLYVTHVLIPPTPGPIAAAGNLGMEGQLGWILLLGIPVSIPAIIAGVLMARRVNHSIETEDETIADSQPGKRPGLRSALLPLLLPVFMIALGTLLPLFSLSPKLLAALALLFHPVTALFISVVLALILPGKGFRSEWGNWIQSALQQAGPIIFITVAGGALGAVLKATALASVFENLVGQSGMTARSMILLAFLLAAALKTAQGSSTAALVITSSVIAPLLGTAFEVAGLKALLVLAIGGGAMTVSHANDSFFWVINQYGGLSTSQTYKHFTVTSLVMGITILISVLLLSLLF